MNNPIHTQPQYQLILKLLNNLDVNDILPRLQGQCIAAADLIQNLLYQHGIQSRIIEVQLTATKKYPDGNTEFMFVGYDNLKNPNEVDTHLIVVTDTDIPMFIDASIGHILRGCSQLVVLHELNSSSNFLADLTIDDVQLTYTMKKSVRLPNLHQRTLLDRLIEEKKIKDTIYWLKIFSITSLSMSIFNMIANSILIILKMIFP